MIQWINKKRNKKGFTLIELVVVIAILGILAAIAIPRLSSSRTTAANSAHNANVRTLEGAASMFMAEKGIPAADVKWTSTGGQAGVVGTDNWAEYLQKWPTMPKGGDTSITGEYEVIIQKDTGLVTVKPNAITLP